MNLALQRFIIWSCFQEIMLGLDVYHFKIKKRGQLPPL